MKTLTIPFEEYESLVNKVKAFEASRKSIYMVQTRNKYEHFTMVESDDVYLTLKGQIEELRRTETNLRDLLRDSIKLNMKTVKYHNAFQKFLIKAFNL